MAVLNLYATTLQLCQPKHNSVVCDATSGTANKVLCRVPHISVQVFYVSDSDAQRELFEGEGTHKRRVDKTGIRGRLGI